LICLGSTFGAEQTKKCVHPATGTNKRFPSNFKFGAATAAYQIEGAWNEDGKGPSIWDIYTHEHPEMIVDQSNGDVAADSYHMFDKDLAALKDLGVRMSLANILKLSLHDFFLRLITIVFRFHGQE